MTAPSLSKHQLLVAGLLLAVCNFVVVLDMTIANVSVPNIAGGLAISTNEGTYVITSYAIAEAISVPLTGWLAARFGTLRVFTTGIFLFGLFSAMCGFATTLGFLVVGRILQGLSGGPLMPLSQTLLMLIFPQEKRMTAMGLWSMTTLVAPILGPIIGGYICDSWGWSWIFFINIPLAILCSIAAWTLLKPFETDIVKSKIDTVGLFLLFTSVGCFQYMLDEGQKLDWFASNEIIALAIIAVVGFIALLIWEATEENPIIDLQVFKYRGFSVSVLAISLIFGAFFGSIVLTPLWLQTNMGYTATWSGLTMAANGVLAVIAAPFAAKLAGKIDPRKLVTLGVFWLGAVTFYRSFGNNEMTYAQIAGPILFQGLGMPFFFIPLSSLALSSVPSRQIATAAGLMSFLRTLSGAFSTSVVTTAWGNQITTDRTDLINIMQPHPEISLTDLDQMVQAQSVMLATNHIFFIASTIFILGGLVVWLAPKPQQAASLSASH